MPAVIHWFRRDLRLTDNPALSAAAASGQPVVPVYILSTWKNQHRWTGPRRQKFLCECLRSLAANLEALGGRLIIRAGDPARVLRELAIESGATAIHFNRDVDPHGKAIESKVAAMAAESGLACQSWKDAVLHEPHEVLTQGGTPFRVFTPYGKVWMPMEKSRPTGKPAPISTPGHLVSLPMPDLSRWGWPESMTGPLPIEAGEKAARQRMKQAVSGIVPGYAETRDIPDGKTTSRLSQDLRFGLISIRELHHLVRAGWEAAPDPATRKGHQVYLQELAWREFYMQVLHHFPEVLDLEFNPNHRGLPWDQDHDRLQRWKDGQTGFPIVDAGMRQLKETGFMPNRVRMIVSMFLTKDLHLDWRLGEQYFMQELLDAEIASNNGGWQWSAGTGADAAPYFRIQNPWTQTKRHDPQGRYIRTWVPELRDTAPEKFFEAPADGRPVARGYPLPMVDHSRERDETLARFQRHTGKAVASQP